MRPNIRVARPTPELGQASPPTWRARPSSRGGVTLAVNLGVGRGPRLLTLVRIGGDALCCCVAPLLTPCTLFPPRQADASAPTPTRRIRFPGDIIKYLPVKVLSPRIRRLFPGPFTQYP